MIGTISLWHYEGFMLYDIYIIDTISLLNSAYAMYVRE